MGFSPAGLLFRKYANEALLPGETDGRSSGSRRRFLRNTAWLGLGTVFSRKIFANDLASFPKIAIIGAGAAGLSAGYILSKNGIPFTLYEGSGRVGGRMFSVRDWIDKDVATDLGGEFVDEEHAHLISLCNELGVELYDLRLDSFFDRKFFVIDGKKYEPADLRKALLPFAGSIRADIEKLPSELHFRNGDAFREFDQVSILQYLEKKGIDGWLKKLIDVIYTAEYGMESAEQTAMNFLVTFKPPVSEGNNVYRIYGDDHEIYKIKGGSETIADRLYGKQAEHVKLNHRLHSYRRMANGTYRLSLTENGKTLSVDADYILFCIPFSILRNIDTNISFPPLKEAAIKELGYGNSSKFILGFNGKPWRAYNESGVIFSDVVGHNIWDNAFAQRTSKGGLTFFSGGKLSAQNAAQGKEEWVREKLHYASQQFHTKDALYNGRHRKICWAENPFAKGGYTSYTTNQWSRFGGMEGESFENIFFAGEHCSLEFQGFMNGAIETGMKAAKQITEKIHANEIPAHAG